MAKNNMVTKSKMERLRKLWGMMSEAVTCYGGTFFDYDCVSENKGMQEAAAGLLDTAERLALPDEEAATVDFLDGLCFEGGPAAAMEEDPDEKGQLRPQVSLYVLLTEGWDKAFPKEARAADEEDAEVDIYLIYDAVNDGFSIETVTKKNDGTQSYEMYGVPGCIEGDVAMKFDSYVSEKWDTTKEKLCRELIENRIVGYAKSLPFAYKCLDAEHGYYFYEIPASYDEWNGAEMQTAFCRRDEGDLRDILHEQIRDRYLEAISDAEDDLLYEAGLSNCRDLDNLEIYDLLRDHVNFGPDHSHFMKMDNVKVDLLLGTDEEQNRDFSDISKMAEAVLNGDTDEGKWDNSLLWLLHEKNYHLKDVVKKIQEMKDRVDEDPRYKEEGCTDDEKILFYLEEHVLDDFLSGIVSALFGASSCMYTLTALTRMDLDTYCELSRKQNSVILPKGTMLCLYNPWNGSGTDLDIILDEDLEVPPEAIWDTQVEGVRDPGRYTVDEAYGLTGSCWTSGVKVAELKRLAS